MSFAQPVIGQTPLTVSGSTPGLAQLQVGNVYSAEVTAVLPGKVEVLIANQYLLAQTNFNFSEGDFVTLKLAERNPGLLIFQLAIQPGLTAEAEQNQLASLLRAGRLADSPQNRTALSLLLQAGVPVTGSSMADISQLSALMSPQLVAGFLPLFRKLLERQIRPGINVLKYMAQLSNEQPQLAGSLASLASAVSRRRPAARQKEDSARADLSTESAIVDDSIDAETLRDQISLLYGSPEAALRKLLASLDSGSAESADLPTAGEAVVELSDLANLLAGRDLSPELLELLDLLQAIRIRAAVDPGRSPLILPLNADGMPTDVSLQLQVLGEQYYQKDYVFSIGIENSSQGQVEVKATTRGPGISIDISAADPVVAAAYLSELEQLEADLAGISGLLVRRLGVSGQRT